MANLKVACVLRSSPDYDIEYVERLKDGVARHLPGVPFVCLSDVPVPCERVPLVENWPGWWSKMELFAPDMKGDVLYFDLDTIIVGDLTDIAAVNRLTMLSDFYRPLLNASGMMFLPEGDRARVWHEWIKDPWRHMSEHRRGGDQAFLGAGYGDTPARWQSLLPGQVVSYKAHVRKAARRNETGDGFVPDGTRVVCFHGEPRPRTIGWKLNVAPDQP